MAATFSRSPRERSECLGPAFAEATAGKGACPAEAQRRRRMGGAACSVLGASPSPPSPASANLGANVALRFDHAAVRFELRGANLT
jgi:hypothetical protein